MSSVIHVSGDKRRMFHAFQKGISEKGSANKFVEYLNLAYVQASIFAYIAECSSKDEIALKIDI